MSTKRHRRRERMLEDLDRDIRDHIERETQDNIERGVPPDEARHAALRKFGNITRVREETRDIWSLLWLEHLVEDIRFGFRLLRKSPGFTAVAIVTLAIGIGANTGIFSVVNGVLLRSLPFREPGRLAFLNQFIPPHDSAKEFHDWRLQSTYLADAALVEEADMNLGDVREPQRAHVAQASWNFFSALGAQPAIGRAFLPGEDSPGRNATAVIGYALWQQLFAGDQKALGATIRIDGMPLTIVGVAPRGFDYPSGTMLWQPASFSAGNNGWETIARLKPGIPWLQARTAFEAEADRFYPNRKNPGYAGPFPQMTPLQDGLAGPVKNASLMLMAGVMLILLTACANVANLLVARTVDSEAELSMRSALGASRGRLVRQLLTECLLLSVAATLAGLVVAFWTASVATKVQPPPLATESYSILDGRVLVFTALSSIIAGLLFGLLPSLYAGRIYGFGIQNPGKGPSQTPGKTRGSRAIREALIAAQVMLTIILLAGSVSVGRAFESLMHTDRGFDAKGLVTVSVSLGGTTHELDKRQLPYFEEALARVRQIPGVRDASATEFLPLYATGFVGGPFGIDGHPARLNSTMVPVLSDYFRTMGEPVLYGREFTDAEVRSGAKVAIVNSLFAAEFGAPSDAVGLLFSMNEQPPRKIIGVVRGMNYGAEIASEWRPTEDTRQVFVPADEPGGFFSTFVARVNGRAEDYLASVRDT